VTIAFFGVAASVADNGTAAGPTATITPPASMTAGQLVTVAVAYRGAGGGNLRVGEHGGQRWSQGKVIIGATVTLKKFWCVFNGTWSANPTFIEHAGGTLALSAIMRVYTPDAGNHWVASIGPNVATFVAGTTPFTKTITGVTTATKHSSNSHVIEGDFASGDDNTWDTLTGANWTQSGLSAQYRNLSGSQMSLALTYQIQSASGATNNVSMNQATLGGDSGATTLTVFTQCTIATGGGDGSGARYVQSKLGGTNASDTTESLSFSATVTSGNSVAAFCFWEDFGGVYPTSLVDDKGNEYIEVQRISNQPLDTCLSSFVKHNITNAPITLTLTISATSIEQDMAMEEVAGTDRLDVYDGVDWQQIDGFNPEAMITPAVTPSVNGCHFSAYVAECDAPVDPQPGTWFTAFTPFTQRENHVGVPPGGPGNQWLGTYDQSTAASQAFGITSNVGRDHTLQMLVFKPNAGGGGIVDNHGLVARRFRTIQKVN
jgi:hypothetical protein